MQFYPVAVYPDEILSGYRSVYPDEFYPFTGLSVYPVYLFYPDEVYPEEGLSV